MAYIDFAPDALQSQPIVQPRHDPVAERAEVRLSALEWSVVALAQKDRLSSLTKPGRLSMALGKVFGSRQHNAELADARLEALRRMAVLVWHHSFQVPTSELKRFFAAGFTPDHFELVAASIGAARPIRGRQA